MALHLCSFRRHGHVCLDVGRCVRLVDGILWNHNQVAWVITVLAARFAMTLALRGVRLRGLQHLVLGVPKLVDYLAGICL